MLIAEVVEKAPLGAAALLRYCEGAALVSAVQPGVPVTAAPPAFTRYRMSPAASRQRSSSCSKSRRSNSRTRSLRLRKSLKLPARRTHAWRDFDIRPSLGGQRSLEVQN